MANYSTPGVYVNESLLNSRAVSYPSGPTAMFVGRTERGPSTPTYIKNWADYRRLYGSLNNAYDTSYSVYHFFTNGGRGCYVSRVLGSGTPVKADVAPATGHDIQGVPFFPYAALSASLTATPSSLEIAAVTTDGITTYAATVTTSAAHDFLVGDRVDLASLTTDTENGTHTITAISESTEGGGYDQFTYTSSVATAALSATSQTGTPTATVTAAHRSRVLFDVEAVSEGSWGNSLSVVVSSGAVDPSSDNFGTFSLVVKLNDVEVERWNELAVEESNSRYVQTVVNTYSDYIRVDSVNPSNAAPSQDSNYYTASLGFSGGVDGDEPTSTEYVAALNKMDTLTGVFLLNAVPYVNSSGYTVGNDQSTTQAFLNKAEARGDSFVIVDPSKGMENISQINTVANYASASNGNYGAHYSPTLLMVDPAKTGPGAVRDTYPGGAIAGLMVRTEAQHTVAKAPAGYSADIRGALGVALSLTDSQVGDLYSGVATPPVNTFKVVPGGGIVVYGARTLTKSGADRFVPVRRTINHLKYELSERTKFAVFQPNDNRLWSQIKGTVSSFLSGFYAEGGLKGRTSSQAYYVTCDETNNTVSTIDQGIVNVEVGIALLYPAEFIVLNISQWTGGANTVDTL